MLEKIWSRHRILERADGQDLLYIDRHLIHDGYAPAFEMSCASVVCARERPERILFGTPDHYVPTNTPRSHAESRTRKNVSDGGQPNRKRARQWGSTLFGLTDATPRHRPRHRTGARHQPTAGMPDRVCGDSHTSTHGALGALAFGIGMTEVAHALATQTLWQRKPKTMRITAGRRAWAQAVTAKDLILAIIAQDRQPPAPLVT